MALRRYHHQTDLEASRPRVCVYVYGFDSLHLRRGQRYSPSVFSHPAPRPQFAPEVMFAPPLEKAWRFPSTRI